MPRKRAFHHLLPYGSDKLAVVGGSRGDGICPTQVDLFDLTTSSWSFPGGLALPVGIKNSCAVEYQGRIFVMGGLSCDDTFIFNNTWIIDTDTGTITDGPSINTRNALSYV